MNNLSSLLKPSSMTQSSMTRWCLFLSLCLTALCIVCSTANASLVRTLGQEPQAWDVASLSFSPEGALLVDTHYGSSARLCNAQSGQLVRKIPHPTQVHLAVFSPKGKLLAVEGYGVIHLWDTRRWKMRRKITLWHATPRDETPRDETPRDETPRDETPRDETPRKGADKKESKSAGKANINAARGSINTLVFAPNGKTLAIGIGNSSVHLFDVQSAQRVRVLWNPGSHMSSLAFSPDSQLLAAGGYEARLWRWRSGKLLHKWPYQDYVAFSPKGYTLATSGSVGPRNHPTYQVSFWNIQSGKLHRAVTGFGSYAPWALAAAPNGHHWAAKTSGPAFVFDLKDRDLNGGSEPKELPEHKTSPPPLVSSLNNYPSLCFSADGKLLAAGGKKGQIFLWDVQSIFR